MKHLNILCKLCLITFILSSALFIGSGNCIKSPNLIASTLRQFDYTEYNDSIGKNNVRSNMNVNNGKIGYVIEHKNKYVLALSAGAADTLPIYLTKAQVTEFKQLKESSKPVLVMAKIIDDGNSVDYYNIEVLDIIDNTYGVNYIDNEQDMFLYVMIASIIGILIWFIKDYNE